MERLHELVDSFTESENARKAEQETQGLAGACVVAAELKVTLEGDECIATGGDV